MMAKNDLLIALVGGVIGLAFLANVVHDKGVLAILVLAFLGGLVYLAKRKPVKAKFTSDSDLCLSIANLLYQQSPHQQRLNQFIFFRQESSCSSVYWSGKYIQESTVFQLSDEALHRLTGMIDALHMYYRQNGLPAWNVVHFSLTANKQRHHLKVDYDHELAINAITFQEYLNNLSNRSTR